MATINYAAERDVASGSVKVEWASMTGGDVGQAFDSAGLKLGSIQYFGTFNGNTCDFQVSNEVSASSFISINNRNSDGIEVPDVSGFASLFGAARPSFAGSGGNIKFAALFVKA